MSNIHIAVLIDPKNTCASSVFAPIATATTTYKQIFDNDMTPPGVSAPHCCGYKWQAFSVLIQERMLDRRKKRNNNYYKTVAPMQTAIFVGQIGSPFQFLIIMVKNCGLLGTKWRKPN